MKKLLTTIILLVTAGVISAQSTSNRFISLELDPAPFILKGYSFSLKFGSKKCPKSSIMASVYASDFPDGMMKKTNRDNGWTNMKYKPSYALFAEFYLNENRKSWYWGPSVFYYNKEVSHESSTTAVSFTSVYPNVRVGYVWAPFKKSGLYLNPWFNIGSEIGLDNNNKLNGQTFELNTLQYIMALHVGYRIDL